MGLTEDISELKDRIDSSIGTKVEPKSIKKIAVAARIKETADLSATVNTDLATHKSNTSNPHGVTKAQVGLGNVDNTPDSGKPVSGPQATAISDAVAAINISIAAEESARIDSDQIITDLVSTETADRISADNTLQTNINNEADTRESADDNLQDQIDAHTTAISNRLTAVQVQVLIDQLETDLLDGVASDGNTLQKLYNLIIGGFLEESFANIAARDAFDVPSLPFQAFVIDDGDGKWAIYKATTTGVGASFTKIGDQDALGAVMSNAQIKIAYESNPDTNAFTNALLAKLNGIAAGATANDTDANLKNRANHTGTQSITTITGLASALALKANLNSPTFTGTVGGITKSMVGLGNVDNTTDLNKPISTATQAALNLKANDADVVHQTGDELNIEGDKHFKDNISIGRPLGSSKYSTRAWAAGAGISTIVDFAEYDGKLWACNWDTDNTIWYWDGSAWVLSFDGTDAVDYSASDQLPFQLCVYNNKLYAAFGSISSTGGYFAGTGVYIMEYDSLVGTWVVSKAVDMANPDTRSAGLVVVDGKLYSVSVGYSTLFGQVWEFNGTSWSLVYSNTALSTVYIWTNGTTGRIISYNNKLYVGSSSGLLEFTPGSMGTPVVVPGSTLYGGIESYAVVNGKLHICIAKISDGQLMHAVYDGSTFSIITPKGGGYGFVRYTSFCSYRNRLWVTDKTSGNGNLLSSTDGVNFKNEYIINTSGNFLGYPFIGVKFAASGKMYMSRTVTGYNRTDDILILEDNGQVDIIDGDVISTDVTVRDYEFFERYSNSGLLLQYGGDYTCLGGTGTWTLPPIGGDAKVGRANMITIKHKGSSGTLTIQSNSGTAIFTTSPVSSISITAGESIMLIPDGVYFNVITLVNEAEFVHQTGDELNIQGEKQFRDNISSGTARSGSKASTISYPVVGAGMQIKKFVVYDNKLWAINRDTDNSVYYSSDGVNWVQSFDGDDWVSNDELPCDLCVYNGSLYVTFMALAATPTVGVAMIYRYNSGTGWTVSKAAADAHTSFFWMQVIGDKMYVAASPAVFPGVANPNNIIYEFDGTTYTPVYSSTAFQFVLGYGVGDHYRGVTYYNGKIYCSMAETADSSKYKTVAFTPVSGGGLTGPVISDSIAGQSIYMNSVAIVNNTLFAACYRSNDGGVYHIRKFDGSTWTDLGLTGYTDLYAYGNRLFATNNLGHLVSSIDGISWWVENKVALPDTRKYGTKCAFNNKLFISHDTRANITTYYPSGLVDILVLNPEGTVETSGGVYAADKFVVHDGVAEEAFGATWDNSKELPTKGEVHAAIESGGVGPSGTWVPTLTGVSNMHTLGVDLSRWMRVGGRVCAMVTASVQPTAGPHVTASFKISLPTEFSATLFTDATRANGNGSSLNPEASKGGIITAVPGESAVLYTFRTYSAIVENTTHCIAIFFDV